MEIKRERYLSKLISFIWDGQVKVITGIRRCGKSYLLHTLFKNYLLGEGVAEDHILSFELDLTRDIRYRNPLELAAHVREIVEHSADQYYLFVDEIQMSDEVPNPYNPDGKKITFYDALNDLKSLSNLDIYVTGSNSKMLSSDILTEFRGRSGENVVALNTVKTYMDHLSDFFLFTECKRWDVKGKSYFDYPNKYYCEDIGLRNARIGFRQQEMTHIMENIIFNELMIRECSVDIGIVYGNEKNAKGRTTPVAREIDFIAASGGKKTYIQSAYALGTEEKAITENKPFALTGDSFPKIIVRHDIRKRWYDDNGILNVGVIDFLLDDTLV